MEPLLLLILNAWGQGGFFAQFQKVMAKRFVGLNFLIKTTLAYMAINTVPEEYRLNTE